VADQPDVEDLGSLPTEELRRRAFSVAEHHLDVRFFWDLIEHFPSTEGIAVEQGSAGEIAGGISEAIEVVRGLLGHGYGDAEPLIRARFIEYLRAHAG
jgi:hypothetical protein